jgi:hypothetical protein
VLQQFRFAFERYVTRISLGLTANQVSRRVYHSLQANAEIYLETGNYTLF